ncbi:hypothetical protein CDAR_5661 [Caerostris darwini]|uniref:Uncharacterized protein n=1 Tax=Caerostris darwini TaxID=1538125 RepID=A0AAV4VG04_9ARAC|nr:hypothetical protein CDAR_5661 [Caerostris darwini]
MSARERETAFRLKGCCIKWPSWAQLLRRQGGNFAAKGEWGNPKRGGKNKLVENLYYYESVKRPVEIFPKQSVPKFREKFSKDQYRSKTDERGSYGNRLPDKWGKRSSLRCCECGGSRYLRSHCPKLVKQNKNNISEDS